jgi:hypothetical protein
MLLTTYPEHRDSYQNAPVFLLYPSVLDQFPNLQIFFILVNKTNKYSKLAISFLGFAEIARPEFETRVRVNFFFCFFLRLCVILKIKHNSQ